MSDRQLQSPILFLLPIVVSGSHPYWKLPITFNTTIVLSSLSILCIQACSSPPVTTQPMANILPNPEFSLKSTQMSGNNTMKQAKVELDIFSGSVNPEWLLLN
jgi:hypothetical protein